MNDLLRKSILSNRDLVKKFSKELSLSNKFKKVNSGLRYYDLSNYLINIAKNGFYKSKSVINDGLAKEFPNIKFEESDTELDHAGDVDYLGFLKDNVAFGVQIKPITAQANFGNYKPTERMQHSFNSFTKDYKGKVFIVFSLDGEIANRGIINDIREEIERLKKTVNYKYGTQ